MRLVFLLEQQHQGIPWQKPVPLPLELQGSLHRISSLMSSKMWPSEMTLPRAVS